MFYVCAPASPASPDQFRERNRFRIPRFRYLSAAQDHGHICCRPLSPAVPQYIELAMANNFLISVAIIYVLPAVLNESVCVRALQPAPEADRYVDGKQKSGRRHLVAGGPRVTSPVSCIGAHFQSSLSTHVLA